MTQTPLQTHMHQREMQIIKTSPLVFTSKPHLKLITYLQSGIRIAKASITNEQPLKGSEENIIKQIHKIRYNKHNPYVITGGHFSQLFVRNLGIFFNALLDPRIPSTEEDWQMRQSIALKTVAFDLELFAQANKEHTTLAQVTGNIYTGLNLYARPSDSLYAILYTLTALKDEHFIAELFPSQNMPEKKLVTKKAAKQLLVSCTPLLSRLIKTYLDDIIDPQTKLIKKDVLLASARDGIKRQSSFYDNVIAWATIRLAKRLHICEMSDTEMMHWKKRIIQTFWDKKTGIFLDDLSQESMKYKLFSADSFIVISTGFLQIKNRRERIYLEQMIQYVKRNKLDKPFPLHYSTQDVPEKLYRPVRHFAPSYMGTSIWSHWGMEYIKTLIFLSKDNSNYQTDAKNHLQTYKKNIEMYGGYPEVYDKNGTLLQTRLYRSVLHNGWVINYEQAKMLLSPTLLKVTIDMH